MEMRRRSRALRTSIAPPGLGFSTRETPRLSMDRLLDSRRNRPRPGFSYGGSTKPFVVSPFASLFSIESSYTFINDVISPFSLIAVGGKLYAAGYDFFPAIFIRIEDPFGDLSNYNGFVMPHSLCIAMVYTAATDRFYCFQQDDLGANHLIIDRINGNTLTAATVINDGAIHGGEGSLDTDGTSLFVCTGDTNVGNGGRLHKYDLATFGTHTVSGAMANMNGPVSCVYDSSKVYLIGHSSGVARVNTATMVVEQSVQMPNDSNINLPQGGFFDDTLTDGTYYWAPAYSDSVLYRLLKTDLTQAVKFSFIPQGTVGLPSYGTGIARSGTKLYITLGDTPGRIARFDTVTGIMQTHQFAPGQMDNPNEICITGGKIFVTNTNPSGTSATPSKIVRLVEIA